MTEAICSSYDFMNTWNSITVTATVCHTKYSNYTFAFVELCLCDVECNKSFFSFQIVLTSDLCVSDHRILPALLIISHLYDIFRCIIFLRPLFILFICTVHVYIYILHYYMLVWNTEQKLALFHKMLSTHSIDIYDISRSFRN